MMPSLSFLFAPLFLLLFIFSFSSCARPFHDDRQSLLQFKKLITSDPYDSMANWDPTTPLCNWTAVTCSHRHPNRVVGLDLSAMDLQGTISPFLGNLSFLRSLNLSHNTLHGHIPPQLGRLFRLKMLRLAYNQLEGSIPSHLGSCRNLTFLSLARNNLGGNIPVELGSLVHLEVLDLQINWLTEYGLGEKVSTQGDVYSYGILLLEMLTRKKPTSDMFDGDLNLSKWVNLALPNRMNEVIDICLLRKVDEYEIEDNDKCKSLHFLLRVGLLCSKDSPEERPTIRDVLMVLESVREDLVKNKVASKKLRPSISTLLSVTSATGNNATTSNDQSSTF